MNQKSIIQKIQALLEAADAQTLEVVLALLESARSSNAVSEPQAAYQTARPAQKLEALIKQLVREEVMEVMEDIGIGRAIEEVQGDDEMVPEKDWSSIFIQGQKARKPGALEGAVTYMADDFDVPLDDFKAYM